MRKRWLNNGEPDETGNYVVVIENTAGQPVSTYKGKDKDELLERVLDSQVNANIELNRIYRTRTPDQGRKPLKLEPKDFTPGDKMRIASEITDPDRVVDVITEVVEARQGITPAGKRLEEMDEEEQNAYYKAEAEAFVAANPLYYPVPQNQQTLFAELERRKYNLTRNNLAIVFQSLLDEGKLILWPAEQEPEEPGAAAPEPNGVNSVSNRTPEPNSPPPTTRPRSISTVIRSTDATASAPPPPRPKKVTRADIEKMSRAEYSDALRNPDFRRQVDALGA
jgi:hypothetical protein